MHVRITSGADAGNRLSVGSGFTIDADNNVLQGAKIVGRRTSNGFGTKELIISNITQGFVQQLVRAVTFRTVGGAAGMRKAVFTVSDGDGGFSMEATKTVNVSG